MFFTNHAVVLMETLGNRLFTEFYTHKRSIFMTVKIDIIADFYARFAIQNKKMFITEEFGFTA
jgi:hypothetical protein